MDVELMLQIIGYVVAGIAFIITTILGVRSGKLSKNSAIEQILEKLPEFITSAEKIFGTKTGEAKNKYVLNLLETECLRANVKVTDEVRTLLSEQVEKVLEAPQKKEITQEV